MIGPKLEAARFLASTMSSTERTNAPLVTGELVWDTTVKALFAGDGSTNGGVPVNMSSGLYFEVTVKRPSSTPTAPVSLLAASLVPPGAKAYITGILVTVNGGTAWTTGHNLLITDTASSPVTAITIATANLTDSAIIDSFKATGVTVASMILAQSGLTAGKGLQVVGDSASIIAGSDLYVTAKGYIK